MLTGLLIFGLAGILLSLTFKPRREEQQFITHQKQDFYHRTHPPQHYRGLYNSGPLFSHDKSHVWDGEKWVPYRSGSWTWLIIGLILGGVLVYFFIG